MREGPAGSLERFFSGAPRESVPAALQSGASRAVRGPDGRGAAVRPPANLLPSMVVWFQL